MLKIKDNVDLKELEKYGYSIGYDDIMQKAYIKTFGYNDYIAIYESKRIYIDIEDFCGNNWKNYVNELLEDLIKAGLVEKVEE